MTRRDFIAWSSYGGGSYSLLSSCTPQPVLQCDDFALVFLETVRSRGLLIDEENRVRTIHNRRGEVGYQILSVRLKDVLWSRLLPIYQGVLGVSSDGWHLISLSLCMDDNIRYRIGFLDLDGNENGVVSYRRAPTTVRADPRRNLFVSSEIASDSPSQQVLRYSIDGFTWKTVEIENKGRWAPQTFGIISKSEEIIFSDGDEVYLLDLRTSKRRSIAKGGWATCSGDGNRFSYCNQDGYLVVGDVSNPTRGEVTPLQARDGMEWSPNGRCGLICQRSRNIGWYSRLNQILSVDVTDWSTTEVVEVGSTWGAGVLRWVRNVDRIQDRLQRWVDDEARLHLGTGGGL